MMLYNLYRFLHTRFPPCNPALTRLQSVSGPPTAPPTTNMVSTSTQTWTFRDSATAVAASVQHQTTLQKLTDTHGRHVPFRSSRLPEQTALLIAQVETSLRPTQARLDTPHPFPTHPINGQHLPPLPTRRHPAASRRTGPTSPLHTILISHLVDLRHRISDGLDPAGHDDKWRSAERRPRRRGSSCSGEVSESLMIRVGIESGGWRWLVWIDLNNVALVDFLSPLPAIGSPLHISGPHRTTASISLPYPIMTSCLSTPPCLTGVGLLTLPPYALYRNITISRKAARLVVKA